ncbi:hypothetical protein [Paludifilum halophilum]|uniref:Uncharacterized protein n=1 Tax=Paludifilum halophilum TaxID=1642702 RepID=A0A235B9G4_9BACL|nr:hypothetical protein [Paludifilum halophilum]OYD08953.1 hypothetical protein CHM34_04035 [Paludifilum halophilum]
MIEVFDCKLNRIGPIPRTRENKQTCVLNKAGEFSFEAPLESFRLDTLDIRPERALERLRHQTFIRWKENGVYRFTGMPEKIEREESAAVAGEKQTPPLYL